MLILLLRRVCADLKGGLVGAIYNADGDRAAGVFTVQRKIDGDDRVMAGNIWGRLQEEQSIPATLELSAGLTMSDVDPLYHTRPEVLRYATLHDPSNTFRAHSASIIRNWDEATATISNRYSIQSVAGDGDYGFYITYGDTEAEVPNTVHFPREAVRNGTYSLDELGYWLWAYGTPFDGSNYGGTDVPYGFIGSSSPGTPYGGRTMAVYGLETPIENLPTGTATYSGRSFIESWDNNLGTVSTGTGMTRLRGDARLEINFGDGSLTGRIDNMERRPPGASRYTALSATTGLDIANGDIVDSQFAATITGTDTSTDTPLAESMRGFEGGLVGAIYGADGSLAGGVFAVQRKNWETTMTA